MSIISSPVVLKEGVSIYDFLNVAESRLKVFRGSFEFSVNSNGSYSLEMHEISVGDSFASLLESFSKSCGDLLEMPFSMKLTDSDAAEDDKRHAMFYAGPTPESAAALEQAEVLKSVILNLEEAGLAHLVPPLQKHFDSVKDFVVSSNSPVSVPFAMMARDEGEPKYFRTLLTIEVISENSPVAQAMDLEALQYGMTHGDCSANLISSSAHELSPDQARSALESQGADPSFFHSLSEDGIDVLADVIG